MVNWLVKRGRKQPVWALSNGRLFGRSIATASLFGRYQMVVCLISQLQQQYRLVIVKWSFGWSVGRLVN